MLRYLCFAVVACSLAACALDMPALAQSFKALPPPGIELEAEVRQTLRKRVDECSSELRAATANAGPTTGWGTDVEVLIRAVELALDQNLFYQPGQVKQANELLDLAQQRMGNWESSQQRMSWLGWDSTAVDRPQMIVGGYRSRLDDSVQPFGLVLPPGFQPDQKPYRLDVWLHGRGDNKTEIPFLIERMTKPGQYVPDDAIVLHPFGRHCNAFKFAGEVDVLEAIEHVASVLPVDRNRIAIRGFSMGGAGCWHLAVHYPGKWFAANPGAGFVDTLVYQGWTEQPPFPFDTTRQKLLRWYDVLPWVSNLRNTRVVAYSGEVDKQKQAADRVIQAAAELGLSTEYVIGEKMGHKIDPPSAARISSILDGWSQDVVDPPRRQLDWVTFTLRYPGIEWLRVDGLRQHWEKASVRAELEGADRVKIKTDGVTHLILDFSHSGHFEAEDLKIEIDGDRLLVADQTKGGGFFARLIRSDEGWFELQAPDERLRKRAGLQGPIDDAFCGRFLFVLPSRPATHGVVERWATRELDYARDRWRRLMRGNVREVMDSELTDEQIQNNHLICFGDFQSNRYLSSIRSQLPIQWSAESIQVGDKTFDPSTHAAVMCYPNPRQPNRYVVVNSGMTFREFSNVSNSRQIAMLPDWAVVETSGSDDSIFPGRIVAEGFFDEQWQLPTSTSQSESP
jgi:pimeloyl-ACP methyl ester carboxylesterase